MKINPIQLLDEAFFSSEIPGSVVIFYNGKWHDRDGNTITLSRTQIKTIISDISRMESANYREMPGYIMLDDAETMTDIVDYLDCELEDAFIFFKGTDMTSDNFINTQKKTASPVSQDNEFARSLYMLASANAISDMVDDADGEIGEAEFAEIADLCGSMGKDSIYMIRNFMKWVQSRGIRGFFCDARQQTSGRIIEGNAFRKYIQAYGFSKLSKSDNDGPANTMSFNLFVEDEWYANLDNEEKGAIDGFINGESELYENLTIPMNQDDDLEKRIYSKLQKNYKHADRIIGWYRNEKKFGASEHELESIFLADLPNIIDLLKTYDAYIDKLGIMKLLGRKVDVNGVWLDPVKDIDKIRKLDGFRSLVSKLGDIANSDAEIYVGVRKYAITEKDKSNIRLLGFTDRIACWCTEGYETTNKFVYQLWRNKKTLGRGDVYGDPDVQTPYCTHSKEHWDEYSIKYRKYQQFWYLKRLGTDDMAEETTHMRFNRLSIDISADNKEKFNEEVAKLKTLQYKTGCLSDPDVARLFNGMAFSGPCTIIAQNDTFEDWLNRYDQHVKYKDLDPDIRSLNEKLFTKIEPDLNAEVSNQRVKVQAKPDFDQRDFYICPINDAQAIEQANIEVEKIPVVFNSGSNRNTGIKDLAGMPEKIRSVYLTDMKDLVSLKGMPEGVCNVDISFCDNLKTFDGMPRIQPGLKLTVGNMNMPDMSGLVFTDKPKTSFHEGGAQFTDCVIDSLDGYAGIPYFLFKHTLVKNMDAGLIPGAVLVFNDCKNFVNRIDWRKIKPVAAEIRIMNNYTFGNDHILDFNFDYIPLKINFKCNFSGISKIQGKYIQMCHNAGAILERVDDEGRMSKDAEYYIIMKNAFTIFFKSHSFEDPLSDDARYRSDGKSFFESVAEACRLQLDSSKVYSFYERIICGNVFDDLILTSADEYSSYFKTLDMKYLKRNKPEDKQNELDDDFDEQLDESEKNRFNRFRRYLYD